MKPEDAAARHNGTGAGPGCEMDACWTLPAADRWITLAEGDTTLCDVAYFDFPGNKIFRSRVGPPVTSTMRHMCRSATEICYRVGEDGEWSAPCRSEREGFEDALREALGVILGEQE